MLIRNYSIEFKIHQDLRPEESYTRQLQIHQERKLQNDVYKHIEPVAIVVFDFFEQNCGRCHYDERKWATFDH